MISTTWARPPGTGPFRPRRIVATLVALAAPLLGGCRGQDAIAAEETGLSADEFVDIVVELRLTERALLDGDSVVERFDHARAAILQRHDATEEEVRAFARASVRDLATFERLWDTISTRLKYAEPVDSL